jgi:ppGpp synthetase/RelA/SpoT-type nucleotidyltranferase
MAMELSKNQVDRLGERLRNDKISDDDLRLLDSYRLSFSEVYEFVAGAIRKELALEPTGRPAKSTTSISDKLRRESIRLTQIQDIAGCRLIVADIAAQDSVVQSLKSLFEHSTVIDRREKPSHGYRAVHVVVKHRGKLIEIQVRTSLQHLWAELSEKFSDIVNPAIKYGGGDEDYQELLIDTSSTIAKVELLEAELEISDVWDDLTNDQKDEISEMKEELVSIRRNMSENYAGYIKRLEKIKRKSNDISD